jgi:hypothetical protein
VGQVWRTRAGDLVEVTDINSARGIVHGLRTRMKEPGLGTSYASFWWLPGGTFFQDASPSTMDLVTLVGDILPEATSPEPEPDTRGGRVVEEPVQTTDTYIYLYADGSVALSFRPYPPDHHRVHGTPLACTHARLCPGHFEDQEAQGALTRAAEDARLRTDRTIP